MKTIITILQGSIMGVAEIIPGVSGSTFALIMGIYDDFINFLHFFSDLGQVLIKIILKKEKPGAFVQKIKDEKEIIIFGVKLVFGMVIAIGILSHFIAAAIGDYPQYVKAFFFGLVLASISIPYREMTKRNYLHLITFIAVFVFTFLLLGLKPLTISDNPSKIFLFFGGIVGISGLILPGVSGSFILLILGLYEYVVETVKQLTSLNIQIDRFLNLAIFGLGIITGFLTFVRVIKYAFIKFPNYLLAGLLGLMIGSLRVIYPFFMADSEGNVVKYLKPFETNGDFSNIIIILCFVLGVGIVVVLNMFKVNKDEIDKIEEI